MAFGNWKIDKKHQVLFLSGWFKGMTGKCFKEPFQFADFMDSLCKYAPFGAPPIPSCVTLTAAVVKNMLS